MSNVLKKHFQNNILVQHFDPENPEHLEAYRMLDKEGRQHPSLRFHLNNVYFSDVPTMMARCIARNLSSKALEEIQKEKCREQKEFSDKGRIIPLKRKVG
jgi:hypothetical protein